ncbi:hypothetical protein N7468_004877 [Penicillium chermesinum]|uniref:Shikimate dehydrogenase substrate binding N-terminal domain-containing protein n=1 Tax=Penicillium chermesinum TaxID=63820 RepID=A0A9W9P9A7_9EURO|nr:uncharacterized protein N7468_004877 [Penicillium chermesinum]KAJ5240258.1 hypothetical protein N7468_004877 [Penicillium chermesinum]KAJ6167127.1 hypothetical protein N7470_002574 [Penicillium chermesinum]
MASQTPSQKTLHLVGIGVTHSIAPKMHNYIAQSLGLPWTFHSTECPTIEDVLALAKEPSTAGLVVTMPYKSTIMRHLDQLDDLSVSIGACNNVYYTSEQPRRLCGTNTDWRGIRGCLLEKGHEAVRPSASSPAPALIIGAGGASRAAAYALATHLHSHRIYVLNRDKGEVLDLIRDLSRLPVAPEIVHVESLEQASQLPSPYYIVGTVPDMEPKSESEKNVASMLEHFLSRGEKGVLLDMCFKPRRTRIIKLAERLGGPTVEGTHVIGYQIHEQYRLWAGEDRAQRIETEKAWDVLLKAAESSPSINF